MRLSTEVGFHGTPQSEPIRATPTDVVWPTFLILPLVSPIHPFAPEARKSAGEMTEYWISKKQYWCKYCNIWIRDDVPSRRQHETGLKHQGNKERFIRDLYKGGDMAKREKAAEAAEMARIESSAAAAYAHDTHSSAPPRQSVLSRLAPSAAASSSRKREAVVKDKWANYSTAKQLGFDDEETSKSSYEIEQELRGRAGEPGAWEVVAEPVTQAGWVEGQAKGGKRKLGDYALGEEEDHEDFKFQHRDKRPVNDVWEEEEWDPRRALGGLRVRVKEERQFGERRSGSRDAEGSVTEVKREEPEGGLKREDWTGRLELKPEGGKEVIGNGKAKEKGRDELVFDRNEGGWIKAEPEENGHSVTALVSGDRGEQTGDEPSSGDRGPSKAVPEQSTDPALELAPPEDTTLDIKPDIGTSSPATNSLFKKRRPPPAARKK